MRPRLPALLLTFSLSALGGCITTKAAPAPLTEEQQLATEGARLAAEASALLKSQDLLVWSYWAEGGHADMVSTYEGKEALFSLDSIRKLDQLRQRTTEPRELRALTALQSHFAGEYLAQQLAEMNDAIANLEASLTFQVDGREVRWRELERLLANERSAPRRKALYTAATPALERLNPLIQRREERTKELVRELGYASYEAFGGELRQADLGRLALLAEEVLQATEAPYKEVMERLAQRELGMPFANLTRADLPRLFRPREVDGLFPKGDQLLRAHGTLSGMDIDLGEMKNVRIDARDDVKRKNPRPLSLGIEVPGDVRLSVRPVEGALAQARLLHEVGHAVHYAYTKEPRFELAKLGNPTVTEAYAALFEDLMEDPVWLEEHAGLTGKDRTAYLAATSAHKLFLIRRAAGRLLYQLALHREEGVDARELYKAMLERVDEMPATNDDVARYLVEQEDFFQSADSFRAWFLAGQLQGQLKARFGPAWWHEPEAGKFLKGLWAHGNALSAREVAESMGEKSISPDVLLLRLGTTLGVPIKLDARDESEAPPVEAPMPTAPASPENTPAEAPAAPAQEPAPAAPAPAPVTPAPASESQPTSAAPRLAPRVAPASKMAKVPASKSAKARKPGSRQARASKSAQSVTSRKKAGSRPAHGHKSRR
ncbi:chromosome segregation protein SMC [Archangium lansingense]|uniref:Chromosome segregation protein SMC n=1 Tax=Archangium lansingense TaxID=2995310 RepID=A0ABT4AGQ4_9BACT|nr:chromosome segregation protein SMC [Archangium lansinium]MCY1080855.1 chromosome segregation protein SMC [Archangium lansinium]